MSIVAWSPDGTKLAVAAANLTLWAVSEDDTKEKLWSQKLICAVSSMAFSHSSTQLAIGDVKNTLNVVNIANEKLCYTMSDPMSGHGRVITCVAWSPDDKHIASGSADNMVRIWDVDNGKLLKILQGHTGLVSGVAWSPNNQQLVSASFDERLLLWSACDDFACTDVLIGHTARVSCVAWKGQLIASGSADKTVRLWNVNEDGNVTSHRVLTGLNKEVVSVMFTPDGKVQAYSE